MANPEHIKILKQGVEAWNEWRRHSASERPNLSNAHLDRLHASGADFHGADFSGLHVQRPDLSRADLHRANLMGASIATADLRGANLEKSNMSWTNLCGAKLGGATLQEAILLGSALRNADLSSANLLSADLSRADLYRAILSGANLKWSDLRFANLSEADLRDCNLSNSCMARTIFGNNDLSQVSGLESVQHEGPSTIGLDTIYCSRANIPEAFLRGAGVPHDFITYMRSVAGRMADFYSCFICHSSRDKEFAQRLHAELQIRAVRCWFAPEDLKIGDEFRTRIEESIRAYDKLLIILSENSIDSEWVKTEVEAAFEKEERQKKLVLFPIRLDDAVMQTARAWAAKIRREKHIGDFRNWKDHEAFKKAFDRLLRDLKASEAGGSTSSGRSGRM